MSQWAGRPQGGNGLLEAQSPSLYLGIWELQTLPCPIYLGAREYCSHGKYNTNRDCHKQVIYGQHCPVRLSLSREHGGGAGQERPPTPKREGSHLDSTPQKYFCLHCVRNSLPPQYPPDLPSRGECSSTRDYCVPVHPHPSLRL